MAKTSNVICELANEWLGKNERDGSHKEIIDVYNSRKKLPRGYKVKYTDSWCATFISALAIQLGYTDIIPIECSCYYMIKLAKSMKIWEENDAYIPTKGDIVMYDWQDNGFGDNVSAPDHVGIVVSVDINAKTFIVIEGNYSNSVKCRTLKFNDKYIRGYILPKYDDSTEIESPKKQATTTKKKVNDTVNITLKVLKKNSKGKQVKTMQNLLWDYGYSIGKAGVDGIFGVVTETALKKYQEDKKLTVDGICGEKTWNSLLK